MIEGTVGDDAGGIVDEANDEGFDGFVEAILEIGSVKRVALPEVVGVSLGEGKPRLGAGIAGRLEEVEGVDGPAECIRRDLTAREQPDGTSQTSPKPSTPSSCATAPRIPAPSSCSPATSPRTSTSRPSCCRLNPPPPTSSGSINSAPTTALPSLVARIPDPHPVLNALLKPTKHRQKMVRKTVAPQPAREKMKPV